MQLSPEVSFPNMDRSEAVETRIRGRAAKLHRFADDVMSCRTMVDVPHSHRRPAGLSPAGVDVELLRREAFRDRVRALVSSKDYGIILASDGRDIHFHRNSVLGADSGRFGVGDEVRFAEETGGGGLQASAERPIGKHHLVS